MDRIRERPIPAAIAAASLAWLFLGKRSLSNYSDSRSLNAGQWPSPRYGSVSSDVNPEPGAGWDYTEEPFASASTGVREASRPDAAAERIRRATATAQQQVRRVAHENTMVAGAAAAVLGLAIGFLLPETERENEMMGEARDSVVDRAKDAARGAAERVKETAEEVQRVATDAITATGSKSQPGTGQS
jgi:hypothetical protein